MNDILELNNTQRKILYKELNDNDNAGFKACVGKNINDDKIYIDFEKTPHVLVGGASGSGKSCLMNCILTSLLTKYDNFLLTIVDIKQVEFLEYKNNKQLATDIVTTPKQAQIILDRYVQLMHKKFNLLAQKGYKNINEWNEKEADKMSRHVIVIDELANIMLDNKQIKILLQKLLQLGRAVGIHLILATQAPNCKTIPTELKININCRIALQVPTAANSKIIIDETGAENLRGHGDALMKVGNIAEDFQCAIVE